ncbi:hypothetical protein, partial [Legionella impletisoli]|uniref:hypothetical protein n=1 Tax=Legionella impletisoli TaxID=343510 RepID=UPI001E3FDE19
MYAPSLAPVSASLKEKIFAKMIFASFFMLRCCHSPPQSHTDVCSFARSCQRLAQGKNLRKNAFFGLAKCQICVQVGLKAILEKLEHTAVCAYFIKLISSQDA